MKNQSGRLDGNPSEALEAGRSHRKGIGRFSTAVRAAAISSVVLGGGLAASQLAGCAGTENSGTHPNVTEQELSKEDVTEDFLSYEEMIQANTIVANWFNTNHPGLAKSEYVDITIKTPENELNVVIGLTGSYEAGPIAPEEIFEFRISSLGSVETGTSFAMTGNTTPPGFSSDLSNGFSIVVGRERTKQAPITYGNQASPTQQERYSIRTEGFQSFDDIAGTPGGESKLSLINVALG